MTELQVGLLVVGALAVAAVLVYNRRQERSARRDAERSHVSSHVDILLDDAVAERIEPTLDTGAGRRPVQGGEGTAGALPDSRIDYLVELQLRNALPGSVLLEQWGPLAHRFGGRGLLAGTQDESAWERIVAGPARRYVHVRAGLQLATRSGPVSEAELIEFRSAVENIAAGLGAKVAAPEMRLAVEDAHALDRLCADADIELALRIVPGPGASFGRAAVEAAAKSAGFTHAFPGQYEMRSADGHLMYVLREDGAAASEDGMAGLVVRLDLPRAADPRRGFESMLRNAYLLAATLGGVVVDEEDRSIDERARAAILAEIDRVVGAMDRHGIAPGSLLALRLFS